MQIRILSCALVMLVARFSSSAQAPAGFELTLVDVNGTSRVVGRLRLNVTLH
jgi:hypothetical protein